MISAFDIHGVVPPIGAGDTGHSSDRSPYATEALSFCQRVDGTPERRTMHRDLLDLKDTLTADGIAISAEPEKTS